ncbi:MAG: hypothetical protein ABSF95_04565 [Verrucomicrobiota bacterium]
MAGAFLEKLFVNALAASSRIAPRGFDAELVDVVEGRVEWPQEEKQ